MGMDNILTIDGPAGSGKSTVSRLLAKKIDYLYLDTGAMYRAVALAACRKGFDLADSKRLGDLCMSIDLHFDNDKDPPRLFLGKEDISVAIRRPEMDMLSSKVSADGEVRKRMTYLQQKMAEGVKIIAEGRDMGTVVFPGAKHKFFLTGLPGVRAARRYRERFERGETVSKRVVETEMEKRDQQDEERSLAPLRPAEDAKIIDSTRMTIEEVVQKILYFIT